MPLPDATPPADSNVYVQLSKQQLLGISKSNFDIVQDPVFIDHPNEDELRRINLVGQATNLQSQSGPIVGASKIQTTLIAAETTGHQDIWIPDEGEIWEVMTMSVTPTSAGTINLSMSLEDADSGARAIIDTGTGNVTGGTIIDAVNGPIYVSKEVFLQSYIGTNGAGVGVTFNIAAVLVRG